MSWGSPAPPPAFFSPLPATELTRMSAETMTRDDMVVHYRPFVESIASKVIKSLKIRVSRDDLVAYGYEGLLQAWERYDKAKGQAAFSSFAYYRVRGAMYDGCRREGWVPRQRKKAAKTQAAINDQMARTAQARAQAPQPKTLAQSVDRVASTIGSALTVMLVEESDLEAVVTPYQPSQSENLYQKQVNEQLNIAISQLDEVERQLIKRHHYLGEPLAQVGRDLGLSTSWCSRMHTRAIDRIRDILLAQTELRGA